MTSDLERPRPIAPGGDAYGTHRVVDPLGGLPHQALRLDNDFTRVFEGEVLLSAETLSIDAASFAQIEQAASRVEGSIEGQIAHTILRTVGDRGKQHNQITGSGGMLLGRVLQIAPGRAGERIAVGDRLATLVSLTLTPLRIDRIRAVRRASAQIDIDGEAVFFASSAYAQLPDDIPERLALAALDVAGAAPQVARLVKQRDVVVVLGAGGKSGVLCVAEARRCGGTGACVVGVEASPRAADDLRALGGCDAVLVADARDPVGVRRAVLQATHGREADVTFSCVSVPDAEAAAILLTRDRGIVYFFAMSTSFTKAALGAEGVGKDVDLFIGNGFAHGHADHTLAMLREMPPLRALFERRYG
ncbi:MAG TPA: L-erythro-3,5-diaminohexanoate dehydrogenase [Polyangiaceae bacterium]|nr:L-erythro-3,5-diaminohexanoate dehydrogenase [Polyangiaceae bacterium]